MKPSIDNRNTEVILRFKPSEYILVNTKGVWTLNPRIDRSYKGKDDDIGMPVINFTNEQEVEVFKLAGFSYRGDY